jgi:hypothetical protein
MTSNSGTKSTEIPSDDAPPLVWAEAYAGLKWQVFPLRAEGDLKAPHPMTKEGRAEGQGAHHAGTDDRGAIRAWWGRSPASGIGVNCKASGLVLVDVDPRKGGDKTLARLRKQFPGMIESSVVGLTGGGGLHLFFLSEEGARYPGTLGDGIDVKHNGYVVLPPSLHPISGKTYRWEQGKTPWEGELHLPVLTLALVSEIAGKRYEARVKTQIDGLAEGDEDDLFATAGRGRKMGLTEQQIRRIVFSIPNSGHPLPVSDPDYPSQGARDYDHWLQVLQGIYHETDGSDEGEAIAREWSEQSPKFVESDFVKKWRSVDVKGKPGIRPVTFRTATKMSNAATQEEREQTFEDIRTGLMESEDLDEVQELANRARDLALTNQLQRETLAAEYRTAVKRITKTTTLSIAQARKAVQYIDPDLRAVPEWCANICFIAGEGVFLDYNDGHTTWTEQAFNLTFMRDAMSEEDIRSGASKPTHQPADLALTRFNVPNVRARAYVPWVKNAEKSPFFERDGHRYVNTYHSRYAAKAPKGELTEDQAEAVTLFIAFMVMLVPDERERTLLLNWIGYVVKTRRRVGWAPVLYSVEGTGKTILMELICEMVGRNNASLITGMALHDKFNGWAEAKLVTCIEEVGAFNRRERFDTMNAIKPVITNERITVRRMRAEPYEIENTTNLILSTNKRDAFDVGKDGGDSRLWFPRVTPQFKSREDVERFKRKNPNYYRAVVDAITQHPGAIKRWIVKEVPYHPDFSPGNRAPDSRVKDELARASKSEEQLLIEEILADEPRRDLTGTLLRVDALTEEFAERDSTVAVPLDRWLASLLRGLGFERVGRLRSGGRGEPHVVYWSRTPERFVDAQGKPIREAVKAWLNGVGGDEDDDPI